MSNALPVLPMRVLVVDDDEDQLLLRSALITNDGFEAVQASSGPAALELATRTHPACAILDLRIPTEDAGFQLIRDLKHLDASIHLIVLTGINPVRIQNHPERPLIDQLLLKPASTRELIKHLRKLDPSRQNNHESP